MVDNETIKQMLDKAGAGPFYFGGGNESFFWRAAEIDNEIFAERAQVVGNCSDYAYYCCAARDKEARLNMYYDMVYDFTTYYCPYLKNDIPSDVFEETASSNDKELMSILDVFRKKYSDFLKDVMYWFANLVEAGLCDGDTYEVVRSCEPCDDVHLIRAVLKRLATSRPIVIDTEDSEYLWQLASANGEIWFHRTIRYYHDDYIFITEEYGHVPREDVDAFGALRDAVRSCFLIEGWEIVEGADDEVSSMLATVGLSSEDLLV